MANVGREGALVALPEFPTDGLAQDAGGDDPAGIFIEFLEQHGLTTDEINYLCLYAIGLRGKEVGEYIQVKRHYIMSHEIRMKLGLDEHETNIGLYIRRLMKSLE